MNNRLLPQPDYIGRSIPRLATTCFLVFCLLAACSKNPTVATIDVVAVDPNTFEIPDTVVVSLAPYASISAALADERNIVWSENTERAKAITLAHAAKELIDHLALLGINAEVALPATTTRTGEIVLAIADDVTTQNLLAGLNLDHASLGDQGYLISPVKNSLYVSANTRIGVLNGVYRLLEELGFAWYDAEKTHIPEPPVGAISWSTIRAKPRVNLRGFWIYGNVTLPENYTIWLARNRLNVAAGIEPHLRGKLGIKEWGGGHALFQEVFSAPGLYEQHPEWYGLINGVLRPVTPGEFYFNPSFANIEAANFFADRIIERLDNGDLSSIDILNIWPADSRFNNFDQSPAALAVGNETDNLLHFYAIVTRRLREAYASGQLSRLVTVAGISYFLTWEPPTNQAVVADLENTNYLHVFYLNERTFSDRIDANLDHRRANRSILDNLSAWQTRADLDYGLVEYYNFSVYAALGLTDLIHITDNYRVLTANRRGLFAYMHPLAKNPGPRRLTNALLAKFGWSDTSDATGEELAALGEQTINAYFEKRYGPYATDWQEIYELMSQSVDNAVEMYAQDSLSWLLFQELIWEVPFYTLEETIAFIAVFRAGGVQDIPGAFSNRITERADFRGLDDSIRLQQIARVKWEAIMAMPLDPEIRVRMKSDTEWFEATSSRYRLMAATCDFVVAQYEHADLAESRARMLNEIEFLESTSVTNDTISPVNQRSFLYMHRNLAGLSE